MPTDESLQHDGTPVGSGGSRRDDRPGAWAWIASIAFRSLVILVVLGIGGAIAATLVMGRTEPAHSGAEDEAIRVRMLETRQMRVRRTWEGYGTARPMNASDVVAEVAGMVVDRPERIEPGRRVRAGEVIVRLDTTDTANALRASEQAAAAIEAQLDGLGVESDRLGTQIAYARDEIEASERDLERIRAAVRAGAGNESQIDAALAQLRRLQREVEALQQRLDMIPSRRAQLAAQLESQRASAETARKNLQRATIRSPIDGVLQSVGPRAGDWVNRGTEVARVVGLSRLEIPVRLPAGAMTWVSRGDPVGLWAGPPGTDPDHEAVITRIAPEADERSRTITVFAELEQDPEDPHRLAPGRFVLGRVRPMDPTPRIVVPRRVIDEGRVMVAIPDTDSDLYRIEARPVRVGYSFDNRFEDLLPAETQWTVIRSGVAPGERVVVSLLDQLVEGMRVGRVSSDGEDAVLGSGAPGNAPTGEAGTASAPAGGGGSWGGGGP